MRARLFLCVLTIALTIASCAGSGAHREGDRSSPPFEVAQLRADMRFLADDLLSGRRAGTAGYDLAARYVASRFEMMGVAPGGTDGYFQPLQLREVTPEVENTSAELSDPRLAAAVRIPDSAYVVADLAHLDVDLTGPMTFVGKGVCDANSGRDDADVDLTGRFAVIVAGIADDLPSERAAVRSEVAAKWACIARHGAIGLVSLRTPKTTFLPWASTIAAYRSGAMGPGFYSGSNSPEPPISFGTSFCFGKPSFICSTVS